MADASTFAAFPLGIAGTPTGLATGPPDDYEQIGQAMQRLQGDGDPLLVRMYIAWFGAGHTDAALTQVASIAASELPWELALVYRDPDGNVAAWSKFVAQVAREHGHRLEVLQVTGEANLSGIPSAADGAFPRAPEALVRGVVAAAQAKRDTGAEVRVGFAAVPELDPAAGEFWPGLRRLGGDVRGRGGLRRARYVPGRVRPADRARWTRRGRGLAAAQSARAGDARRRTRRLRADPDLRERLADRTRPARGGCAATTRRSPRSSGSSR